ncbi:hypothetical protein [Candidatus Palauibacter sp.]|uniref:hypothetical protein n=1 Tax=Candidatus Palauibacter sp. TaxID=3101350 RepID=UPI003B5CC2A2
MGAAVLVLSPWAGWGDVTAQNEENHAAAAERIARVLLGIRAEYGFPDDGGAWGLVVGRFAKGDEKALDFSARVGEAYVIVGIGLDDADVDIRLFGPDGELIKEDVLDDHVPVVSFTAETRGTYRAVMSAAAVSGGSSYGGMAVLRPPVEGSGRGEPEVTPIGTADAPWRQDHRGHRSVAR